MNTVIKGSDLTIGIDIGGTKISTGVVDSSGNLIDSSKCSTPAEGGKELISTVVNLVKELNKKHEIKGIGISIAALISYTLPVPAFVKVSFAVFTSPAVPPQVNLPTE